MNIEKITDITKEVENNAKNLRALAVITLDHDGFCKIMSEGMAQDVVFCSANLNLFLNELLSGRLAKNKPELVK